ncbi:polyprenyl synthetase family protein [Nocardioides rubriscoriae]|uniref:polyprenyl synthetase family protein n=1 Tax=Nocardioides rubriscoriae TaxID=642762 RepID=UPI0011DFF202|nr:polyprenyl synthetase family protein [Nocardioides rubriscoriae]
MSSPTTDQALQRLLAQGRARARATDPDHARLWDALISATEGGKRFRPALVVATHDALGGGAGSAAAVTGAAVELLHTALVVHDDVIDGDDVRRGRPNVNGTVCAGALAGGATLDQALHLGRTAGILAGDLALAAAIRAVATCGASPAVTHRLLDLFDAALHTTAAGELADVRLSLRSGAASLAESLAMEEQKTSAYSFALPLQAGAVLAGADDTTVERLGEAGRMLGVAFQLVDDLLGVFGDPVRTGKSATSDLRAGKQTPLLAHARSTPEWVHIASYVGRELTQDELSEARRLLTDSGSRRFVEDLAAAHREAARAVVEELGISADLLEAVTMLPVGLADSHEVAV